MCAMVKSRYIGDGHPTFNRNPYTGYINPCYWVDDHPLLYGNNGSYSLDPGTCSNKTELELGQLWMPLLHPMLQHCHPNRGICHTDQQCSQGSSKEQCHGAAWDDIGMMFSNVLV